MYQVKVSIEDDIFRPDSRHANVGLAYREVILGCCGKVTSSGYFNAFWEESLKLSGQVPAKRDPRVGV